MKIEYAEEFKGIVSKAKAAQKPMRVAIAGADVENILLGAFAAQEEGFVEPILVGREKKIREMLKRLGLEDRPYQLQPIDSSANAVQYAIEMIQAGQADALMRGNTQTRDFLMPVLNKANHLIRKDALVTHVVFLKVPGYEKLLAPERLRRGEAQHRPAEPGGDPQLPDAGHRGGRQHRPPASAPPHRRLQHRGPHRL